MNNAEKLARVIGRSIDPFGALYGDVRSIICNKWPSICELWLSKRNEPNSLKEYFKLWQQMRRKIVPMFRTIRGAKICSFIEYCDAGMRSTIDITIDRDGYRVWFEIARNTHEPGSMLYLELLYPRFSFGLNSSIRISNSAYCSDWPSTDELRDYA